MRSNCTRGRHSESAGVCVLIVCRHTIVCVCSVLVNSVLLLLAMLVFKSSGPWSTMCVLALMYCTHMYVRMYVQICIVYVYIFCCSSLLCCVCVCMCVCVCVCLCVCVFWSILYAFNCVGVVVDLYYIW